MAAEYRDCAAEISKGIGLHGIENLKAHSRLRQVFTIFQTYRPQRILDIGCGEGQIPYCLKVFSQAPEVLGIDCNDDFVKVANQLGVRAIKLDIEAGPLPFEDNSFDGIFCGELIEHVRDTDQLLEEIFRILDPSGFAVITTPNLAAWYNRIALVFGFQPFWTDTGYKYSAGKMMRFGESGGGHMRVFTLRALVQSLVWHGFDIVGIRGTYLPLPRSGFITTLYDAVGEMTSIITSLSGDLIAVVRKKT